MKKLKNEAKQQKGRFFLMLLGKLAASVCVCMCVCVCVCVCLRPFNAKVSSVWISWNTTKQVNDVMVKTLISYVKSLHCYFKMQHLTFLTNQFILLNQSASRFQNMRISATIIRHHLRSVLHRKSICLWRLHLREGSQSNQERLR